jgi:hypothetical protein
MVLQAMDLKSVHLTIVSIRNSHLPQVVVPDYFNGDPWPVGAMTGEAVRVLHYIFGLMAADHSSIR